MTLRKVSMVVNNTNLRCDVCNSLDIIETTEGYVCRECAVVLKIQKLQYDRPYNSDLVQCARGLGKTQIGTKRERAFSPDSRRLKRLNLQNSHLPNEELVEEKARREVLRILARLDLPETCEPFIMEKFRAVRKRLKTGTKFRNAEKLATVLTFIGLKLKNIAINSRNIIEVSSLTDEEFRSFFTQAAHYIPEYAARNRQEYISQKILEITEHFGMQMSFYFLAKKVLYKLWESVKNTTDNIIAGLCTAITALCKYREEVKVNSICKFLSIRMSTIQFQVRTKIFEHYNIEGFSTLVRSSELLKRFMVKIGVIGYEEDIISEEEHDDGIIEVQLGNAQQVFNPLYSYYLFGITDNNNVNTIGYLEVYNTPNKKIFKRRNNTRWFDLTLGEYFPAKGPPGIG
ncbi:MAG: hypothetical protein ACFFA0_05190 [Promethearchaeota archaeon]